MVHHISTAIKFYSTFNSFSTSYSVSSLTSTLSWYYISVYYCGHHIPNSVHEHNIMLADPHVGLDLSPLTLQQYRVNEHTEVHLQLGLEPTHFSIRRVSTMSCDGSYSRDCTPIITLKQLLS